MEKRKLFIIVTGIVGLLIIIGVFVVSNFIHNRLTENLIVQYSTQENILARTVARTIETEIAQTEARLRLIAKLPEVISGNKDVCTKKLKEIFDNPQIKVANLGRVGKDGIFHCSLNEKLVGMEAEKLGSYITRIFIDPDHKATMSRAIKPAGAASYVVAVHVPVYDQKGVFQGTLGGAVSLVDIERLYLTGISIAPGGYFALYDDDGTVLYNYKKELIGLNIANPDFQQYVKPAFSPEETIADIRNGISENRRYSFDNDPKIAAFEPIHLLDDRKWRIVVTVPVKAAEDTIAEIGLAALLKELPIILSSFVFLILSGFFWIVRREIFIPMEEIDKAKTEFVSLASHQLRTPLSSVNWYSEILLVGDVGELNPKQKDCVNEIYDANQRMIALVDSLLNVSHFELGAFVIEPEPVNIVALTESVIYEQKPQIETRKLNVKQIFADNIPILSADPNLLRMVLQNLLSNSVKYTPEGGNIEVELKLEQSNIFIRVSDNGYGITESQQDKIFTKLFRAENIKIKDTQGTGLGLYIVKSIVEHSGGTIRFESEENKGTTFYVTLPVDGMAKKEGIKRQPIVTRGSKLPTQDEHGHI